MFFYLLVLKYYKINDNNEKCALCTSENLTIQFHVVSLTKLMIMR